MIGSKESHLITVDGTAILSLQPVVLAFCSKLSKLRNRATHPPPTSLFWRIVRQGHPVGSHMIGMKDE